MSSAQAVNGSDRVANNGGGVEIEVDIDPAVFQKFADLEKEFASVELDLLRRKEFRLKPLYNRRTALTPSIPNFWPAVLLNGPQEFQSILSSRDAETVAAVKSLNVERYQIKSDTEGEPRSLRFTFEFDENDWFEDTKVIKEFEFVVDEDEDEDQDDNNTSSEKGTSGAFVSKPVGFKWKKTGKKANNGLLNLAVDLYKAEEAIKLKDGKTGRDLKVIEREGLWQYEKLRERLEKMQDDEDTETSWLDWFGYRGAVGPKVNKKNSKTKTAENENKGDDEDDLDLDEEDDDDLVPEDMLDVEIFPAGDEIAIALAEDLWPNVMDYFMASQQEPMLDEDGYDEAFELEGDSEDDNDDEGDEVPDLVESKDDDRPPAKRQKRA